MFNSFSISRYLFNFIFKSLNPVLNVLTNSFFLSLSCTLFIILKTKLGFGNLKWFWASFSFQQLAYWTHLQYVLVFLLKSFLRWNEDDKLSNFFIQKLWRINFIIFRIIHAWWTLFRQGKYIILKCNKNLFSYFVKFFCIKKWTCFLRLAFLPCLFIFASLCFVPW